MLRIFRCNKLISEINIHAIYDIHLQKNSEFNINDSTFKGSGLIEIKDNSVVSSNVFEDASIYVNSNCIIREGNVFEGYVKIQSHVNVGNKNILKGPIKIWKHVKIGDFNYIGPNSIIEDHVRIKYLISLKSWTTLPAYSDVKMIDNSFFYYNSYKNVIEGRGSWDDVAKHIDRRFYQKIK